MYDIFISYSRKDTAVADRICKALDWQGISYFIDRRGIGGGQEFPEVLANAIIGCRIMLYLASENGYKSKFTSNEITFAFNEKPKGCILPYIIDGSRLPSTQRFIFASVNIRTLEEHPIETVLMRDLCQLLQREYKDMPVKTENTNHKEETAERYQLQTDAKQKKEVIVGREKEQERVENLSELDALELKLVSRRRNLIGKKLYGYADKAGNVVIPCQWVYARDFSEGFACVEDADRGMTYIDKTGKEMLPRNRFGFLHDFSEGLARVHDYKTNKYGFINKTFKLAIPCEWEDAEDFHNGYAFVKDGDGKWGVIDKTGRIVVPCHLSDSYADSYEERWIRDVSGNCGFVYRRKVIIPFKWKDAKPFRPGYDSLAPVQDNNGKWGFINQKGKLKIPCQWEDANTDWSTYRVKDGEGIFWEIDKDGRKIKKVY